MGLDKQKKILTEDLFERDPFSAKNARLRKAERTDLPNRTDDVTLDKHQQIAFSFQYVLQKLLQNDMFIDRYLNATKDRMNSIDVGRVIQAFDFDPEGNEYPSEDDSGLSTYQQFFNDHVQKFHTEPAVALSAVNKRYLKSDARNIDIDGAKGIDFAEEDKGKQFQKVIPYVKDEDDDISQTTLNDFVVKTEFDDSPDVPRATNYVSIAVSNKKTGNVFRTNMNNVSNLMKQLPSTSNSKYIYKEWLSGLKELYIYIPTTFTFYNEEPSEDLREQATFIRVRISKRHFPINHIYNMQICGQSLPLMIHKVKKDYYGDVIQPSMVRTATVSNSSDISKSNVDYAYDSASNIYTFYFCCCGTDA